MTIDKTTPTAPDYAGALKNMPDGSDINDLPDWAFAYKQAIRQALALAADPWNTNMDDAPRDGTEIGIGVFLDWSQASKEPDEPRVGNGFYDCGAYWYEQGTDVWRNRLGKFISATSVFSWRHLPAAPAERG